MSSPRTPLRFDIAVLDALVAEPGPANEHYRRPLLSFAEAQADFLPVPTWDGRPEVTACYWKAWELAWRNIGLPNGRNGVRQPYVRTAFNDGIFLWDSVFITRWADYGRRACALIRTLDIFYQKQHQGRPHAGFIPRTINEGAGDSPHSPHDLNATGPNVLAWGEWEHWLHGGDRARLGRVFPRLLAYHRWTRLHRSWPDGGYYYTTISSGMDNQRRHDESPSTTFWHHNFMTWIDATAHAILSAETLVRMAAVLGREGEVSEEQAEARFLAEHVNARMWDEERGFYVDTYRDGSRHDCLTIGAYWLLLTDAVPADRLARFVGALEDPAHFLRPHRVPSTSASDPSYAEGSDDYWQGNYWRGCVWPPTNHMVMRGLQRQGRDALAGDIARNHFENVLAVWRETRSFYENYRPERPAPGAQAHADFVGWGGIGPIATLFEGVFGLRPDAPARRLTLDVTLTDGYGVERYPLGADGVADIRVAPRRSAGERPEISVESTVPFTLDLRWAGGREERPIQPTSHHA